MNLLSSVIQIRRFIFLFSYLRDLLLFDHFKHQRRIALGYLLWCLQYAHGQFPITKQHPDLIARLDLCARFGHTAVDIDALLIGQLFCDRSALQDASRL